MAGGAGERFWPLSTPDRPKQLLDLTGSGKTLLQQAVDRLAPCVDEVFISTSEVLAPVLVKAGVVPEDHILAEPCRRNTAGALVWCMATLPGDRPFLAAVTTADHAISPDARFQADIEQAFTLATGERALVTLGITPTRPETGFGYIETGSGTEVLRFTEKPDAEVAAEFVAKGSFLWNSGMFFWRSDTFEAELDLHAPCHSHAFRQLLGNPDPDVFAALPSVSIDYALMEKSANVRCVRASFSWDDVGTWDALLRTVPCDSGGNAVVGKATLIDCKGCVVYNATHQPLCLVESQDQIVVATDHATLVTPVSSAQAVRKAASAFSS